MEAEVGAAGQALSTGRPLPGEAPSTEDPIPARDILWSTSPSVTERWNKLDGLPPFAPSRSPKSSVLQSCRERTTRVITARLVSYPLFQGAPGSLMYSVAVLEKTIFNFKSLGHTGSFTAGLLRGFNVSTNTLISKREIECAVLPKLSWSRNP